MKKANCILVVNTTGDLEIACPKPQQCDFKIGTFGKCKFMVCVPEQPYTFAKNVCQSPDAQREFLNRVSKWANERLCSMAHEAAEAKNTRGTP